MNSGAGIALFRRACALRSIGVVLAAFALLIQMWLPSLHHPAVATLNVYQSDERAAVFFSDRLIICGVGVDEQDRSGTPGKLPSPQKLPPCPICQALQLLGGLLPPSRIIVLDAPAPNHFQRILVDQVLIDARSLDSAAQPRAPPA